MSSATATTTNGAAPHDSPDMLWQRSCFVARLVASAVKTSEHAGSVIKSIMSKGDLKVISKGVNDLQTEADRAAQYCIIKSLRKTFGQQLVVIGEEEKESVVHEIEEGFCPLVLKQSLDVPASISSISNNEVVIWVDPLDGTNEFAEGILEPVTVLIGIAHRGRPIAGIIHQPYYGHQSDKDPQSEVGIGRTIWAIMGVGTFGIDLKPKDPACKSVVTTRSHPTPIVQDALDALLEKKLADKVLKVGGAGFKVLQLLDAGVHAYVFASPGCKKWDTCAPEAVLMAAGGELTDMHGSLLLYDEDVQRKNSAGVLATAPGVEIKPFMAAIPQHVKDALPAKL